MMRRNELLFSDEELIDCLYQGYQIRAVTLYFVNVGSFYGFIVETKENKKYFLKIYPKDQSLVPNPPTIESLHQTGIALNRFKHNFGMTNLSCMLVDVKENYCFTTNGLILTLYDYIEGVHPSYAPNQLLNDKMAALLFQLHRIPSSAFPAFVRENFNIDYALGMSEWIGHSIEITDTTHARSIFSKLNENKEQLLNGLTQLQQWGKQFSKMSLPFVITHGDPHHYNVLQTPLDVWLIDWDGIKIAPRERDLWHYLDTPLMKAYSKICPQFTINKNLCKFYRLQRFFEDCRY
ncbi:TPA: phosphotransferase, partial [Legionella pneumophila]|nr:phosphotransferase [Legionella pneumophila]